jgi:hypothetical protein
MAGGIMAISLILLAGVGVALAGAVCWFGRKWHLDRWLVPYLLQARKRCPPGADEEIHLILCIADHFEPKAGGAAPDKAQARVDHWVCEYPRQFGQFRDSDGRPPRHTFFYPIEEYEPAYLDALGELCRAGHGEVEIHLHHDNDTPENLRAQLHKYKEIFAESHGLLSRHRQTGELAYGFIHGNWALCNSRPDGQWCGVNDELDVLRTTGCYADFTMPSAPHVTQARKINSLYYAVNIHGLPRSHDRGVDVGTAPQPPNSLLLVQGPLVLDWRHRKAGLIPSLENGCIQGSQPPAMERMHAWMRARVQVPSRPDWFFVKLHTHGAEEQSQEALLGDPMRRFHRDLADLAQKNPRFHYHYVTAREMYNLIKAAEVGWLGSVADALDFELVWNGCAAPNRPQVASCASMRDTIPLFAAVPPGTTQPARSRGRAAPG